jgi:hypothetical protein
MKTTRSIINVAVLAALCAATALAEDVYYEVPVNTLVFTQGALPSTADASFGRLWRRQPALAAYAVLDGDGEVYLSDNLNEPWRPPGQQTELSSLFIRVSKEREITGRLIVPQPDLSGMILLRFKVPRDARRTESDTAFLRAKERHYRFLLDRTIPGGAWFRSQAEQARKARTGSSTPAPTAPEQTGRAPASTMEDTYALFTGGRAISENLQLDRQWIAARAEDATVDITTLTGLTVKAMDWKTLIKDAQPELDPLASKIPADQYALFFPSFEAMTQVMDEADRNGTPILQLIEPRAEDADSRGRYHQQLCLNLSDISRLLGPQLITSVAFTGSDPYLRAGTDVAVLFECKTPGAVKTFIIARQAAAAQANREVETVSGSVAYVAYNGVVSSNRAISSFVAVLDNVVLVSNSRAQLTELIQAGQGKKPALSSQGEYLYFRQRYPRQGAQETGFLILSDAAIRRWCGPQWRIASSRRTRVAAILAELQAQNLDAIVKGVAEPRALQPSVQVAGAGEFRLTSHGVASSTYGSLDFLTPIAEIPLAKVTPAEADTYRRWRDSYQQNWRQFFDPIAVRFSIRAQQLGAEVIVMPLIAGTDYREYMEISKGARIAPDAGDPHADALLHFVTAINADSPPVRQAVNFMGNLAPGLKANALGWLGQSIAVFADRDPFWDDLSKATNRDTFLEHEFYRFPIAVRCEVKNPLGLALFLTAVRTQVEQTAPKMTIWENAEYQGQAYVKITPARNADTGMDALNKLAIYYAVSPKSLLLTVNESVLKRALDRQAAREAALAAGKPAPVSDRPWLGTNLCLQAEQVAFRVVHSMNDNLQTEQQLLCWNNLPILNEWKRRFPDQDPVKLHERLWQAKLFCPGGGTYQWNEKWQTMESTAFGHPGEPKAGEPKYVPLQGIAAANLGLNFENQGLSAKIELTRETKKP